MTYIDNFVPDLFADGTYVVSQGVYPDDFSVPFFTTNFPPYDIVWYDPRVALPNPFSLGLVFIGPVDYTPGDFVDPDTAPFREWAGFTDTGGNGYPAAGGPNGVMGGIEGTDSALVLRLVGYDDTLPDEAFDLTVGIPTPSWWGFGDASWTVSLALTPSGLLTAQLSGGEGVPSIPARGSADGWIAISHLVPEDLMAAWAARSLYPTGASGEVDYFESWGYDVEAGGPPLVPGKLRASLDVSSGARPQTRVAAHAASAS